VLFKRWAQLLLGTSARRPLLGLLMSTPSMLNLLRTWCRTSLKLTKGQQVQGHPAYRYLPHHLLA
jgi:hypothetical protein